jgi:hypothetical protein
MKLVAVDGNAYSAKALRQAIVRAHRDGKPLRLKATAAGVTREYAVHYAGGLKYPHLVRVPGRPDYLKEILEPRRPDRGA